LNSVSAKTLNGNPERICDVTQTNVTSALTFEYIIPMIKYVKISKV